MVGLLGYPLLLLALLLLQVAEHAAVLLSKDSDSLVQLVALPLALAVVHLQLQHSPSWEVPLRCLALAAFLAEASVVT